MITTVVFDLDDTLYDEIDYCKSGLTCAAEFLAGLPKFPSVQQIFDALWKQFTAGNRKKTFNAILDELGIGHDDSSRRRLSEPERDRLIEELVNIYRKHVPQITLPDDSKSVLEQLSKKYDLALLTDGFLPAQQLKVQALGIEVYFRCIIYTEQLGREFWKPSPVGFEKLLQRLNSKPQNTAYIADNEKKDFIAPNNLGLPTIQIIRPARILTESCEKIGASAQYVIRQLSQLPALLERL
jgi:putative hydrolase of the HAD superfamily